MASTISHSPEDTYAVAYSYARGLEAGDVVGLIGDLGAGKTQFVKGLAAGLGYASDVTSPTFTLIHEYQGGRLPLYHVDFYRLEDQDEVATLGFDDYLGGDGVVIVEWADQFPALLPRYTRWIELKILRGDMREIRETERPAEK